jgi:hypothetical protein
MKNHFPKAKRNSMTSASSKMGPIPKFTSISNPMATHIHPEGVESFVVHRKRLPGKNRWL